MRAYLTITHPNNVKFIVDTISNDDAHYVDSFESGYDRNKNETHVRCKLEEINQDNDEYISEDTLFNHIKNGRPFQINIWVDAENCVMPSEFESGKLNELSGFLTITACEIQFHTQSITLSDEQITKNITVNTYG